MNSVKIYDDVLTKDDLEFIKENYFTESKTSAIDILCELDNFLKKEILYSLAFDFDNSNAQSNAESPPPNIDIFFFLNKSLLTTE